MKTKDDSMIEEEEAITVLFHAMRAARQAFQDYIWKEKGLDPAYWELGELTGYTLSTKDFRRVEKLILNDTLLSEDQEGERR